MGNFSRDTFDRLKHYVGVRLQQGVPIVDADWNELEDIRKYELQAFLKWFVGNGVPQGNDGFRIQPVATANDFSIKGGDGTAEGAGRCLVDGWDVMIEADLNYSEQPLYNNTALASAWGVDPLDPLSTPDSNRTDTVYLDVWEREVDSSEDEDLVNPAIGIETAVRLKREWVVRVVQGGTSLPAPPQGHAFYPLAHLNRVGGQPAIPADQIVDLRLTGLSIISQHDVQQIAADAYGAGYTLDHDGQPNLKVDLRTAINALLRGGLPSTPGTSITSDVSYGEPSSILRDNTGAIWLFQYAATVGDWDVWYKIYDPIAGAWGPDVQLTTDTSTDYAPKAISAGDGDVWVFWYSNRSGNFDIWYNRYRRSSDSWGGDTALTTDSAADYNPFAVVDSKGDIWVFWESNRSGNGNIWGRRFFRELGFWGADTAITSDTFSNSNVFAAADTQGNVTVFRTSQIDNSSILYKRFTRDSGWGRAIQLTTAAEYDRLPLALVDDEDDIWAFWVRTTLVSASHIWHQRLITTI